MSYLFFIIESVVLSNFDYVLQNKKTTHHRRSVFELMYINYNFLGHTLF